MWPFIPNEQHSSVMLAYSLLRPQKHSNHTSIRTAPPLTCSAPHASPTFQSCRRRFSCRLGRLTPSPSPFPRTSPILPSRPPSRLRPSSWRHCHFQLSRPPAHYSQPPHPSLRPTLFPHHPRFRARAARVAAFSRQRRITCPPPAHAQPAGRGRRVSGARRRRG